MESGQSALSIEILQVLAGLVRRVLGYLGLKPLASLYQAPRPQSSLNPRLG